MGWSYDNWYCFHFPLQDARLKEGVERYKALGWQRVAEHVGEGVLSQQCRIRWSGHLRFILEGKKKGGWSDEEVGSHALSLRHH